MKNTVKKYFLFSLLLASAFRLLGTGIKTAGPQNNIKFTENKSQWDKKVLYRAQLDGGALFLEKNAFTYNFYDKERLRHNHAGQNSNDIRTGPIRSHAFRMTFLNALPEVQTTAREKTHDYNNYFIGKDKKKWAGEARNFREINYKEIYEGTDLQILGMQNSVKYNFIVSPKGNPNDIKLFYEGLD